jgi:hypothetical protein
MGDDFVLKSNTVLVQLSCTNNQYIRDIIKYAAKFEKFSTIRLSFRPNGLRINAVENDGEGRSIFANFYLAHEAYFHYSHNRAPATTLDFTFDYRLIEVLDNLQTDVSCWTLKWLHIETTNTGNYLERIQPENFPTKSGFQLAIEETYNSCHCRYEVLPVNDTWFMPSVYNLAEYDALLQDKSVSDYYLSKVGWGLRMPVDPFINVFTYFRNMGDVIVIKSCDSGIQLTNTNKAEDGKASLSVLIPLTVDNFVGTKPKESWCLTVKKNLFNKIFSCHNPGSVVDIFIISDDAYAITIKSEWDCTVTEFVFPKAEFSHRPLRMNPHHRMDFQSVYQSFDEFL